MPREFNRSERVAGQMRRELAQLVQSEVKDPAVGFVSISDVEVSRDLAHAKVYVTVFNIEHAADSIRALQRAAGFLRTRLGQNMHIRNVPELHFRHDDSVEKGMHIDRLIASAVGEDEDPERGDTGNGRDDESED